MPGEAIVRPATPADAEACAQIHHSVWVDTYSDLLPASHWETDTVARRTASWRRWLDDGAPFMVAEVEGRVVGFALAREGREVGGYSPVRDRELYSLYVLTSHHGTGTVQGLLDAVVPPGTPAQLWVAEQNPRARRFYERNFFVHDGARFIDSTGIAEVRYVR